MKELLGKTINRGVRLGNDNILNEIWKSLKELLGKPIIRGVRLENVNIMEE